MPSGYKTFICFLLLIIVQRLFELRFSKANEKVLIKYFGAYPINPKEYQTVKVFHTLWFVSLFLEGYIKGFWNEQIVVLISILVVIIAQSLRYLSMKELKQYWTANILVVPGMEYTFKGIYKWIKHPSYLAVVLEFIFVPLIYSCYFTLIIFSLINLGVILNRVALEKNAYKLVK